MRSRKNNFLLFGVIFILSFSLWKVYKIWRAKKLATTTPIGPILFLDFWRKLMSDSIDDML